MRGPPDQEHRAIERGAAGYGITPEEDGNNITVPFRQHAIPISFEER